MAEALSCDMITQQRLRLMLARAAPHSLFSTASALLNACISACHLTLSGRLSMIRHGTCAGGLEQRVEALAAAARMQAGAAEGAQLTTLNGTLDESSLQKASRLLWLTCPADIVHRICCSRHVTVPLQQL